MNSATAFPVFDLILRLLLRDTVMPIRCRAEWFHRAFVSNGVANARLPGKLTERKQSLQEVVQFRQLLFVKVPTCCTRRDGASW